jgi:hypothetical protein
LQQIDAPSSFSDMTSINHHLGGVDTNTDHGIERMRVSEAAISMIPPGWKRLPLTGETIQHSISTASWEMAAMPGLGGLPPPFRSKNHLVLAAK